MDKDNVIFQLSETYKVLEIVTPHFNQIMDYQAMIQGCKDAIALLKEQEAEIERLKTPTAGDNEIPLKW